MSITFQGDQIHILGTLPKKNLLAPDFTLVKNDLTAITLKELLGKQLILNVFVSIDTPVCSMSVKKFNQEASKIDNTRVLCVSMDLPFAFKRFCAAEGIDNVVTASAFRNPEFGKNYGLTIVGGPLSHLLSRAIFIIDKEGKIVYCEHVPEITNEPNYSNVLELCRNQ